MVGFNSPSNLLIGTPTNNDVGDHYVSLSVSDGKTTVYDNFTITVHNINDLPVITSTPVTSATVGEYYSYQFTASDIDGDNLILSAIALPSWLSFNLSTGLLYGTPLISNVGNNWVDLRVTDGIAQVGQVFNIYVPNTGTITDSRDGNTYNWVKIGDKIWMAENLAYLPFVCPSSLGSTTEPYYYVYGYEGNSVSEAKVLTNYLDYGVLYNWPAAMNGALSSRCQIPAV